MGDSAPAIEGSTRHYRPGEHSHNRKRRCDSAATQRSGLRRIQTFLLILGLFGVGYYGYTLCDRYVYQAYENWAFNEQIAGHGSVGFRDYLRAQTPLGAIMAARVTARPKPVSKPAAPPTTAAIPPPEGALLGRLGIERLHVSAIVRQGVDTKMLAVAVGHVPSTALPGHPGNFAIAAHRDTLFRALKDIKKGDLVTFQSTNGTYTYQVLTTKIVKPTDVSVLSSNGGGLIPGINGARDNLLTMITCYPFNYVGSAPKRFIVEAKLVPGDANSKAAMDEATHTSSQANSATSGSSTVGQP
ncbi:MAG: class D sortase [Acidobacteriaceae bacterium]|nr:class D sortase [Acidobacteriaceae bacterium]